MESDSLQPEILSQQIMGVQQSSIRAQQCLKAVVGTLHQIGIRMIVYLDNMAQLKEALSQHLSAALHVLISLGFIINSKKSVFTPTRELKFLGFMVNVLSMSTALLQKKVNIIRQAASQLVQKGNQQLGILLTCWA